MTALSTDIDQAEARYVELLMSPETAAQFDKYCVTEDDNNIGLRIEDAVETALFRLIPDEMTDEQIDNVLCEAYVRQPDEIELSLRGMRFR